MAKRTIAHIGHLFQELAIQILLSGMFSQTLLAVKQTRQMFQGMTLIQGNNQKQEQRRL